MTIVLICMVIILVMLYETIRLLSRMFNKYYYVKIMDNFDVYNYIDNILIMNVSMYIHDNYKDTTIEDDKLIEISKDIINEYISTISSDVLNKISVYIRYDKIDIVISRRLLIILIEYIKNHNNKVLNGGD